ncbi:hypothetical protein AsAng_0005190 [Aureispira anguillae]|uniref:Uncharacterized protein n=1 Tax=Aureispira anguillae TaxID=2864201 RepID=A0A915YB39_9BACT|nr:hypothetical protein AsAng_0005190 [Aureispira anguillae]
MRSLCLVLLAGDCLVFDGNVTKMRADNIVQQRTKQTKDLLKNPLHTTKVRLFVNISSISPSSPLFF